MCIGYEQDVIKYAKVVNETVGEIINIREKVSFYLFLVWIWLRCYK